MAPSSWRKSPSRDVESCLASGTCGRVVRSPCLPAEKARSSSALDVLKSNCNIWLVLFQSTQSKRDRVKCCTSFFCNLRPNFQLFIVARLVSLVHSFPEMTPQGLQRRSRRWGGCGGRGGGAGQASSGLLGMTLTFQAGLEAELGSACGPRSQGSSFHLPLASAWVALIRQPLALLGPESQFTMRNSHSCSGAGVQGTPVSSSLGFDSSAEQDDCFASRKTGLSARVSLHTV